MSTKKEKVTVEQVGTELVTHKSTSIGLAMELLMQKKNELQQVHETKYKTKGEVNLGSGKTVNIFEEKDIPTIITAYCAVKARLLQIQDGEADFKHLDDIGLGIKKTTEVCGGTLSDWKEDVELRIKKLNTEVKYAAISKKADELKALLSNEDKISILMNEINGM